MNRNGCMDMAASPWMGLEKERPATAAMITAQRPPGKDQDEAVRGPWESDAYPGEKAGFLEKPGFGGASRNRYPPARRLDRGRPAVQTHYGPFERSSRPRSRSERSGAALAGRRLSWGNISWS